MKKYLFRNKSGETQIVDSIQEGSVRVPAGETREFLKTDLYAFEVERCRAFFEISEPEAPEPKKTKPEVSQDVRN